MYSISEVALIAVVRAEITNEGERRGLAEDIEQYGLQPGQKLMEAGVLLEMFAPVHLPGGNFPRMSATYGSGTGAKNTPLKKLKRIFRS